MKKINVRSFIIAAALLAPIFGFAEAGDHEGKPRDREVAECRPLDESQKKFFTKYRDEIEQLVTLSKDNPKKVQMIENELGKLLNNSSKSWDGAEFVGHSKNASGVLVNGTVLVQQNSNAKKAGFGYVVMDLVKNEKRGFSEKPTYLKIGKTEKWVASEGDSYFFGTTELKVTGKKNVGKSLAYVDVQNPDSKKEYQITNSYVGGKWTVIKVDEK